MAKKEDQEQEKDIAQETENLDQKEAQEQEEQVEELKEPTLEDKYNELNDKYLRLYSDFDNFRKRTIKEKADLISNANAGVLKDLLTVLDDFERAIVSNENTEDVNGLKE
jgi:molecular chaperone GrpE